MSRPWRDHQAEARRCKGSSSRGLLSSFSGSLPAKKSRSNRLGSHSTEGGPETNDAARRGCDITPAMHHPDTATAKSHGRVSNAQMPPDQLQGSSRRAVSLVNVAKVFGAAMFRILSLWLVCQPLAAYKVHSLHAGGVACSEHRKARRKYGTAWQSRTQTKL